jgi:hypothetical protein
MRLVSSIHAINPENILYIFRPKNDAFPHTYKPNFLAIKEMRAGD